MRYAALILGCILFADLLSAYPDPNCYQVDYLGGQQLLLKITPIESSNIFGKYQVQFFGNEQASNPLIVRLIQRCLTHKNCNLFEARGQDQNLILRLQFNGILNTQKGILSMQEPVRDRTGGGIILKEREFDYHEVECG